MNKTGWRALGAVYLGFGLGALFSGHTEFMIGACVGAAAYAFVWVRLEADDDE